jgi:colanic acid/amylovoran biosynthesis glycosyltransferase
MRIAVIVKRFPSASETFVLDQITGLIDRGHMVDIFALYKGDARTMHPDVTEYGLLDRTHYPPSVPRQRLMRAIKGALILFDERKSARALWRTLDVFRYGREAASLRLLFQAVPFILSRNDYDVLHCHFGPVGVVVATMKRIGAIQGPLITTFHGYDMSLQIERFGSGVYEGLFSTGDLFLPVSDRWKSRLIEMGCDASKVLVHRMGVRCEQWPFRRRSRPDRGPVKILSVGRLVEKKGFEYGVRAVARLGGRYPELEYDIVGEGASRERLSHLIAEMKMDGRIRLVGWKDHHEVARLVAEASLFLCPSMTSASGDEEGIPVALMEAMASGLPVISTNHSGIPELVEDGVSGYLVGQRDAEALAGRIAHLMEHPDLWAPMGFAGHLRVQAHHNLDILNDQLADIYQRLCRDSRANCACEPGASNRLSGHISQPHADHHRSSAEHPGQFRG